MRRRSLVALRWVTVLAVAVTAAVVGWQVHTRPPVHEARMDVLFLAPSAPPFFNQYWLFRPDLAATAEVVVHTVTANVTRRQIDSEGLLPSYDVILTNTGTEEEPQYGVPTVVVTASDHDAAVTRRTVERVGALLVSELRARQLAFTTNDDFFITARRIGTPVVRTIRGQPSRSLAAIALLALEGLVAAAVLGRRIGRRSDGPTGGPLERNGRPTGPDPNADRDLAQSFDRPRRLAPVPADWKPAP